MAKAKTVRANRVRLINALPCALWATDERTKIKTRLAKDKCLNCRNNRFCLAHELYWPLRDDELGHFLAIALDSPDKVSYAAKAVHKSDEVKRMKLSFARYVRRQLGISAERLPDDILAAIQARLIAITQVDFGEDVLVIKRGDELCKAYNACTGVASCMTGPERLPLRALYRANPAVVGLVVFKPHERTYRALLWECEDGKQLLDRIYPADGSADYVALVRWARNNKILVSGNDAISKLVVRLPNGNVDKYPYLDTFRYGAWGDDAKTVLRLRPGRDMDLTDGYRRQHWPLYIESNILHDLNNKPVPCAHCRQNFPKDKLVDGPDERKYCPECMAILHQVCGSCGHQAWHTDMLSIVAGEGTTPRVPVCKACHAKAVACKWCGEHWPAKFVNADMYCRECATYAPKEG